MKLSTLLKKITKLPWILSRNATGEWSEIHSQSGGMVADFATVRKPEENASNALFALHAANHLPTVLCDFGYLLDKHDHDVDVCGCQCCVHVRQAEDVKAGK